ncbi:uncharacterized protein [Oryza sativa Japonica Group]|uniref:Os12g0599900 protein n=2 Tax=Oryza sativa subsp. japonica TaxID=39947 RepID=Q2QML4_ORYSJ|nr:ankyrin-1 isoform X1 [Oryza sativa Japonica Group]ABA99779.1 TPR Domain containing protein, expressed [Oryza sativa Japonica Group]KAF2908679.1 hypothetical protein DAI22_12g201066 [Oryza sativa Japonica Group]BAF30220.1 Os12g0599900 [Oryza sativa Japonica Group]BAT17946.1 Os12g0599900 [Oryza sativa Japonica Group]|eukprot:NP_001067201.1 Os12g0599900 [Oryza sativa Japonica Group]
MASSPSAVVLQAALDGDLHLLCEMAKKLDLRGFKDMNGRNALHLAASYGHLEICKFLVEESGLDVNSGSHRGETPILLAACDGDINVLIYLLDHGGDPAIPNAGGFMPLHYAAEYGHVDVVRLLLSKGVHVDPLNYSGAPLHLATANDHDQVAKVLLEHGADPNRVVNHVLSPLVVACCSHSLKCMKLLIKAGADVNDRSSTGPRTTPLVLAVDDGSADIVKILLEAGADPNIRNEDGRIPIMMAAARGQRELVEILFPRTKPIPCLPDWSVDGIIRTMRFTRTEPEDAVPVEILVSDSKLNAKEAFAEGEYITAIYFYTKALEKAPLDATLFANRSLCWLRLREGDVALLDARRCKALRPGWSKAWYREGAALSLLKNYREAAAAFTEALKLDPENYEIKIALREALECRKRAARSEEDKNP